MTSESVASSDAEGQLLPNSLHLLWPTLVHVRDLEGYEEANAEMAAVISKVYESFRKKNVKQEGDLGLDDLENLNNAHSGYWSNLWGTFRERVGKCVSQHKEKHTYDKCLQKAYQSHPLMRTKGHTKFRKEVLRYVKEFLVTLGKSEEAEKVREDEIFFWGTVHKEGMHHGQHDHPGSLVSGTYYCTVPGDGGHLRVFDTRDTTNVARSLTIKARGARMVLFPGWLSHQVLPTKGVNGRIGMAFNLERPDSTAWVPTSHAVKVVNIRGDGQAALSSE
jgi:uncharacterized protein (TIGR02466 family)